MYINLNSPPAYLSPLVHKRVQKHLKIIIKICTVVSTNIYTTYNDTFNTIVQLIRRAGNGGCAF